MVGEEYGNDLNGGGITCINEGLWSAEYFVRTFSFLTHENMQIEDTKCSILMKFQ